MEFSGWEKLSLVDYDDRISTTLFMAGCNFRCPFCHNSSLVLHPGDNPKIPWTEIMAYLEKRKGVIEAVVVTGGEPTLMPDLKEKLRDIRSLGYEIKLDSNGSHPEVLRDLVAAKLVDYIAMDIKNSPEKYAVTAGVPNIGLAPIEESVEFLKSSGIRYEFRTTIIAEYHTEKDLEEIAKWLKGADRYFLQRYIDSEYCISHGLHPIAKEKADIFLSIASKLIKCVKLRGYDS